MRSDLADMTALDARERMLRGEFKAIDLTEVLLQRIREKEPTVAASLRGLARRDAFSRRVG